MKISALQSMTQTYSSRHTCGFSLFNDVSKLGFKVCHGQFAFRQDGKNKTVYFANDLEKIILGHFTLRNKMAFLAVDANGDFYLINKMKGVEALSLLQALEKSKFNSIFLEWYQTIFSEKYNIDYYACLTSNQLETYGRKGFSCNVINGLNCAITAYTKPVVRKYSIIVHECLNSSNTKSYILEDKKKKLVFFFEKLDCLVDSELAKQHSISIEFIEYTPNITPYYALA
jgi:hypothetical protein